MKGASIFTTSQPCAINPYAIKVGDRVAVWGTVTDMFGLSDRPANFNVRVETDAIIRVEPHEIALHEPKPEEPIKVGDVVHVEGDADNFRWRVIAIDGDMAWVGCGGAYVDRRRQVCELHRLSRA